MGIVETTAVVPVNAKKQRKKKRKQSTGTNGRPSINITGDVGESEIPVTTATPTNTIDDDSTRQTTLQAQMSKNGVSTQPLFLSKISTTTKWNNSKKFITITDGPIYNELLQNSYVGFAYIPAAAVTSAAAAERTVNPSNIGKNHSNFHEISQRTLQALYDYYQYDIIMAGGAKHASRTFVRRTIVGDPGMTYKYLGLRLFTHAWCNDNPTTTTTSTESGKTSNKSKSTVSSLFQNVYKLNQAMIQMTAQQVQSYQAATGKVVPNHLYNYNITLINYMEPYQRNNESSSSGNNNGSSYLRDEEYYNMGKASVSWHADSSLQDYSCIGVYHTLLDTHKPPSTSTNRRMMMRGGPGSAGGSSSNNENGTIENEEGTYDDDWKIALRPNPTAAEKSNSTGTRSKKRRFNTSTTVNTTDDNNHVGLSLLSSPPPPPIVIPTKSGDVYCLLDEFNHKFQHMVLAGSNRQCRISSTHRVAVTTTDTYHYMAQACSTALVASKLEMKQSPNLADWDISVLLQTQSVLFEVEFEWIAQYWIQGAQHDVQHVWWQKPIRALEDAWNALERLTYKIYTKIITSTATTTITDAATLFPSRELVQGLLLALQTRHEMRLKWNIRRADKIYRRRISLPYQPVEHPIFPPLPIITAGSCNPEQQQQQHVLLQKQLPKDLSEAIQTLTELIEFYPKHNCSSVKMNTNRKSS